MDSRRSVYCITYICPCMLGHLFCCALIETCTGTMIACMFKLANRTFSESLVSSHFKGGGVLHASPSPMFLAIWRIWRTLFFFLPKNVLLVPERSHVKISEKLSKITF